MIALLLCIYTVSNSFACDLSNFISGCIKPTNDGSGSQTVTLLITSTCFSGLSLWIYKGAYPIPSGITVTSADFVYLPSPSYPPVYIGSNIKVTYTIPMAQTVPLSSCLNCYFSYSATEVPWKDFITHSYFTICPCVTKGCYINDPNPADPLDIELFSSAAGPTPLYITYSYPFGSPYFGYTSDGSPGILSGTSYIHNVLCTGDHATSYSSGSITIYTSDIITDPTSDANLVYSEFDILPCEFYSAGCYMATGTTGCIVCPGTKTLTVHTNLSTGPIYMWYGTYGPIASSSIMYSGTDYIATFDLTSYPTVTTCITCYFSNTTVNPAPNSGVMICPCPEPIQDNGTYTAGCYNTSVKTGCIVCPVSNILTVNTSNSIGPIYLWYDTYGPIASSSLVFNGTNYTATFDLSSYPAITTCNTYYFSAYSSDRANAKSVFICPCPYTEGNPDQGTYSAGCVSTISTSGCMVCPLSTILTVHTSISTGPIYVWFGSYGPIVNSSLVFNGIDYDATFDISAYPAITSCTSFSFSNIISSPGSSLVVCPCTSIINPANKSSGNTNVKSNLNINNFTLIPNPNRGTFTIQGTLADVAPTAEVNFEVLDILGKTIITDVATIENGSINKTITLADNIANGMYMLRIKADGTNKVIKFTLDR